ncbi:MAG TPA: hypothetical protein VM370_01635 [Candidatus Thermoplasmatota archaeon]|nr:hypothetical protein [Candidatus Thermoplasmatota archaeon]
MDERFGRHWETWRELRKGGKTPADLLPTIADETLVELLAYSRGGNDVERNVIATELLNRLSGRHRDLEEHGERVKSLLDENQAALARATEADDELEVQAREYVEGASRTSRHFGQRTGGW